MSTASGRPLPVVDALNAPHWKGAHDGELRVQRCTACGALRYPPSRWCAECRSDAAEWVALSGRGRIWSWCVFHHAYFKGIELPYAVVLVELEEGLRLYANLADVPLNKVEIGLPVRAVFVQGGEGIGLVNFALDR